MLHDTYAIDDSVTRTSCTRPNLNQTFALQAGHQETQHSMSTMVDFLKDWLSACAKTRSDFCNIMLSRQTAAISLHDLWPPETTCMVLRIFADFSEHKMLHSDKLCISSSRNEPKLTLLQPI